MQRSIVRIVFCSQETAFCIRHLAEVVLDILRELARRLNIVVGFTRGSGGIRKECGSRFAAAGIALAESRGRRRIEGSMRTFLPGDEAGGRTGGVCMAGGTGRRFALGAECFSFEAAFFLSGWSEGAT